jgi:chemotaxis protein methyltransferase CheR
MAFESFYHDSPTLELLIERAMPVLDDQACTRIWNAGCGNGTEPYTLAMLLREQMADEDFRTVRIYATDIDSQFGEQIAEGMYAEQEVKRIPYPIRYRSFQVTDRPGYVQVVDEIRSAVFFAQHDLLSLAPPREDFSLIVCRNIMSVFDETECRQVFRMFHRAMQPGGLLAVEHTQKTREGLTQLFEPVASCSQVYRRVDTYETRHKHINGSHASVERPRKNTHRVRHVF